MLERAYCFLDLRFLKLRNTRIYNPSIELIKINKLRDQKIHKLKKYNGEFDPGSGRTLAACLTHASLRRTISSEIK